MSNFFEDTFVGSFGDERLAKRARSLAAKMAAAETSVVRRLASGRAETVAFGRFLDNEAVTTAGIFAAAGAATAKQQFSFCRSKSLRERAALPFACLRTRGHTRSGSAAPRTPQLLISWNK